MQPLINSDAEEAPISRLVLEKIQLHWGKPLSIEGWNGLRESLHADVNYDIVNREFQLAVKTMMLGLTDERRCISYPATWQDHRRKAFLNWLASKGWLTEAGQKPPTGWRRTFWQWVYKQVQPRLCAVKYTTEEVQVYQSACPHISAGPKHNPRLCIDYLHRMDARGYLEVDYLISKAHARMSATITEMDEAKDLAGIMEQSFKMNAAAHETRSLLSAALDALGREKT